MNGGWRTLFYALVLAGILAGASAVILTQVTAAEVDQLQEDVGTLKDRDRENAAKIEGIAQKVAATKDQVGRIEDKLDRLIDQLPSQRRSTQ